MDYSGTRMEIEWSRVGLEWDESGNSGTRVGHICGNRVGLEWTTVEQELESVQWY